MFFFLHVFSSLVSGDVEGRFDQLFSRINSIQKKSGTFDVSVVPRTKGMWTEAWQNQQNDLCTQQRLRSAWASTQSDQSLRCLHEESGGP